MKLTFCLAQAALVITLLGHRSAFAAPPSAADGPVGYATVGGRTPGGAGGPVVMVTNTADFVRFIDANDSCVIYVSGTLPIRGMDTHVRPNKTIIGLGTNAVLEGGGLYLYRSTNVIIRNLTIRGSTEDNVSLVYSSNVWVDHCTLIDAKDGLMDITRASDNITISWCKFYYSTRQPHALACLLGASDRETISDNRLHVTFHHNWWAENCQERMPSIRRGTVHLFNNYYTATGNNYCIRTRLNAQSRIENNVFAGVRNPWEVYITDPTNAVGRVFATNNLERNTTWGTTTTNKNGRQIVLMVPGTNTVFTPPYAYTPDPPDQVPSLISNYCGAGAISFQR